LYKYAVELKKREASALKELYRQRLMSWRREPAFVRVERPLRLPRARTLGYKAKQGFNVVRVRVRRGGLRKSRPAGGRRQRHSGITKFTPGKSMQLIAEERAAKRFPNLAVLNSYWAGEDGQHKWFEVILVDVHHPAVQNDADVNWLCARSQKGRVFRGLTSAGKKMRGLKRA
jgi:large subunit ribosomal protein L15e